MKKTCLLLLLVLLSCNIKASALAGDTIKLYYKIAVSDLSEGMKAKIDSLIYFDKLLPGKKLGIIGYADYLGSDTCNITLSENRANKVKAYLVAMGIKPEDIQMVVGKGEVSRAVTGNEGYAEDRRVDIIPGGIKTIPTKSVASKPAPPKTIDLSQAKTNETIRMDNIYFIGGSHRVRDGSVPELMKLLNTMRAHPTLSIQIEGHICCLSANTSFDGLDYNNQEWRLSENRAKAVYEYLTDNGIESNRVKYKGFGITKPLVWPEQSEADENRNRRVEIRILKR
jgi:outer membrane protein OmpA-like peptidoglycan-associated protein